MKFIKAKVFAPILAMSVVLSYVGVVKLRQKYEHLSKVCLVDLTKNGGYYEVLENTENSYILHGVGSGYYKDPFPKVDSKHNPNLVKIDCFEEIQSLYMKHMKGIHK